MSLVFPSATWAEAYRDAINANPLYKQTAAGWDQGAIALVCKADPALGIDAPQAIVLDLERGQCKAVAYDDQAALAKAPFVIEASYLQWKAVMTGATDPIKAMLQGQLRLTRGHLPTIIKDVEGSKQLVLSAKTIDTQFLA
ncbi:MAG TPA: SCP2 sterol-binding domain-containing protein [Polyangiales bacterium]|nr:SCP2 sterol-binding domain-containing protein [Polyangiales bacterium]